MQNTQTEKYANWCQVQNSLFVSQKKIILRALRLFLKKPVDLFVGSIWSIFFKEKENICKLMFILDIKNKKFESISLDLTDNHYSPK